MSENNSSAGVSQNDSQRDKNRRMVLITDGYSNPVTAKTASCLLRFCPEEIVASWIVRQKPPPLKVSWEWEGIFP